MRSRPASPASLKRSIDLAPQPRRRWTAGGAGRVLAAAVALASTASPAAVAQSSLPLLLDFRHNPPDSTTSYGGMSDQYVAGQSITTPAHEDGGVSSSYNTYNNIPAANVTSGLVYGDGTTSASGVSVTWGRSTTAGGTVNYGDTSNLAADTAPANSNYQEYDNPLFRHVIYSTGNTQEQAVRIDGLPDGTYAVYFVNGYRYSGLARSHNCSVQIGVNLDRFDPTLAQFVGGDTADGVFHAPGEYAWQLVEIDEDNNDALDVIVRGHVWSDGARSCVFNLLEIVPVENVPPATTGVTLPQIGVHVGAGNPNPIDKFAIWAGHDVIWDVDFFDEAAPTWAGIESPSVANQNIANWVAAEPGRKFVLSVGMLPNSTSGGGFDHSFPADPDDNDDHFIALAENLIGKGLGDSIIRLGWEFNGDWYAWSAQRTTHAFWIDYWRSIVDAMRGVGSQGGHPNNLTFCWNPSLGAADTYGDLMSDATDVWPGDAYVDYIGLDVYDQSNDQYVFDDLSEEEIRAKRERGVNTLISQSGGLTFWTKFAATHGKPLCLPEWGLKRNSADPPGGGDSTYFVDAMHAYIVNPGNNVQWQAYFIGPQHHIYPGVDGTRQTEFPDAAAEYLTRFANVPTAVSSDLNIGSPAPDGWAAYNPADHSWTLAGNGAVVGHAPDDFHFTSLAVSGDHAVMARVGSYTSIDPVGKAGVMMRNGTGDSASFAAVFVGPGGVKFRYRSGSGSPAAITATSDDDPAWVKVVRTGNVFTGYYATTTRRPDNADWIVIGSATPSFNSNYHAGLFVADGDNRRMNFARFTSFEVRPNAAPNDGWSNADIGSVAFPGSTGYEPFRHTIASGGASVWAPPDSLHYASASADGDVTIIARIDSITDTANNALAGVMFRASTAANAPFVLLAVNPSGQLKFNYRDTAGANAQAKASQQLFRPTPEDPLWVRLVKSGNTFTVAYEDSGKTTAPNTQTTPPTSWTSFGGSVNVSLGSTFRAGIFATSNTSALNYSTFGYVEVDDD